MQFSKQKPFKLHSSSSSSLFLSLLLLLSFPAHPRYFNQLSTGLDMVGLAADWLTSTANTNM